MGEKDSLFLFMDGLAVWAKMELQRGGVQTLAQAIQAAESFIELKRIGDSSKPKDKWGKPAKGGGEKEKLSKEFPPKSTLEKRKFRGNTNGGSDRLKKLACYFCGYSHKAMDCPKRANLAALVQREDEKQPEDTRVTSSPRCYQGKGG